jgi:hypothetical protein
MARTSANYIGPFSTNSLISMAGSCQNSSCTVNPACCKTVKKHSNTVNLACWKLSKQQLNCKPRGEILGGSVSQTSIPLQRNIKEMVLFFLQRIFRQEHNLFPMFRTQSGIYYIYPRFLRITFKTIVQAQKQTEK